MAGPGLCFFGRHHRGASTPVFLPDVHWRRRHELPTHGMDPVRWLESPRPGADEDPAGVPTEKPSHASRRIYCGGTTRRRSASWRRLERAYDECRSGSRNRGTVGELRAGHEREWQWQHEAGQNERIPQPLWWDQHLTAGKTSIPKAERPVQLASVTPGLASR